MAYRLTSWRVLMECMAPGPVTVLDGEPEAEAFVADGMRRLLGLLANAKLTAPQRAGAFGSVVHALADVPHVTSLVLGHYARRFSPDQRRRVALAFRAYAARFYDGRLWDGRTDRVTVLGSINRRPGEIVVTFAIDLDRGLAPIQMAWRVLKSARGWRLIDVEYRGTWLVTSHRRAFEAALLEAGDDTEALIQRLNGGAASEPQAL
jgi:phospholipid transport system substrate-binding protein